ncbi:MAG: hypothetical protein MUF51_09820 [Vicinamibacteria bacterium]|nr:hypothetical protein [Vicinamibacteria bacterium]
MKMRALLVLSAVWFSAVGLLAQEAPTDAIVAELLGKLPSFGATSGRTALRISRAMAIPNSEGKAHFVEVQWQAAGKTGTALTIIAVRAGAPDGIEWLAQSGPWGLMRIDETKNWNDLIADLRRARINANEAATLGNVRSMMSSQAAFGNAFKGFAPEVRCLLKPSDCIPGAQDVKYIDDAFLAVERYGYRYSVYPGLPAMDAAARKNKLVRSFAFVAVPAEVNETGRRAFCGQITLEKLDYSFCATEDGSLPLVKNGQCQLPCQPLQ